MRSLAGTLVLVVVAAGLGAALYLTRDPGTTNAGLMHPLLGGRRLLEAERIVLQNDVEGGQIHLSRDGAGYRLEEPLRDLASQAFLQQVAMAFDTALAIKAFAGAEITEKVLLETGLAKPRCRVELRYADGQTVTVELGLEGVTGTDLFVRKDGSVWRTGLAVYSSLRATLADMRERNVFLNTLATGVRRFTLQRRTEAGKLERIVLVTEGELLRLVEPVQARPDLEAAQALVLPVLAMRVEAFLAGALNPRPDPDWVIEVDGSFGKERLQLWGKAGETLLGQQAPRGIEFSVAAAHFPRLLGTPLDALRARLLVPIPPEQVHGLTLDPGPGRGKALVLVPGLTGGLRLAQPVAAETDPVALAELLAALARLQAEEFLPESQDFGRFGLDEASAASLQILGQFAQRPTKVIFGRDEGEFTFARRTDESFVVKVRTSAVAALRGDWSALVSKQVQRLTVPPERLTVARGAQVTRYVRGVDGKWRKDGQGEPLGVVGETVNVLSDLRAKATHDPAVIGALPEPLQIELAAGSGDVFATLQVAPRGKSALVTTGKLAVVYELTELDARAVLELVGR